MYQEGKEGTMTKSNTVVPYPTYQTYQPYPTYPAAEQAQVQFQVHRGEEEAIPNEICPTNVADPSTKMEMAKWMINGKPAKRRFVGWAKRLGKWTVVVPGEMIFAYTHTAMCCGCCGSFGNPMTPILEEKTYAETFPDKDARGFAGIMSGFMSMIRMGCCFLTCAGCCGLACTPRDGISMVKYDEED